MCSSHNWLLVLKLYIFTQQIFTVALPAHMFIRFTLCNKKNMLEYCCSLNTKGN